MRGPRRPAAVALLAVVLLILAVALTGDAASPFIAVVPVWAAAVVWSFDARRSVPLLGGATALAVAAWIADPLPTAALGSVVVGIVAGGLLGALLRRATVRLRLRQRRLLALEEEARRGASAQPSSPSLRLRALEAALDSARSQIGAARAVLWEVEPGNQRMVPRLAVPGPVGRPISLAGTPMRWVWEERMALRLEPRPGAPGALAGAGGACAVPVGGDSVLAFEFEAGMLPPDVAPAEDAGRYLAALLDLQSSQRGADAARARFDQLLGVLERLTAAGTVESWAANLAETARVLTGGTGAAVASWRPEGGGRVLATAGDDGGPAVGQGVETGGSEMAMAARIGAPIVRPDVGAARIPVASAQERWYARPRSLAVLPLETSDGVLALVAAWNADVPGIDEAGLGTLRTLSPYAALQLRQLVVQDTLRERAERDALTGLPNRGAFDERLQAEIAHFRRYRHPLSVIILDIDHFKRVNDTWGHDAGDAVLRQVGRIIAGSIRETDHAARLGGEEFAVLLPETDLAQAVETAERIRAAVERASVEHDGQTLRVQVSAGVASTPAVVRDPTALTASADAALYRSKQAGRNRVTSASASEPSSIASGK